jgi:hypothetical protein
MSIEKQTVELNCCCKTEKCRCKEILIIQRFIKKCNSLYKKLPSFIYNKKELNYYDIDKFVVSKKSENDNNNKIREHIICAIVNDKIPTDFYKYSKRWSNIQKGVNVFIIELIKRKNITENIKSIKCNYKGGRNCHYDFTIVINKALKFNLEFKFNATNIDDTPQFVSPMKPSQYLTDSYEEYYYDNYLIKLSSLFNLPLPNRDVYLNTIHSTSPLCVKEYQTKYYNGCKTSSQYTKKEEDIKFYEYAIKTSKESITNFIEKTELKIEKLTNYLKDTQKDKIYMLYKNNKFYIEEVNIHNYEIIEYTKNPSKSTYIAKTKTEKQIKILLRWKNGNGIAYPAFQIS